VDFESKAHANIEMPSFGELFSVFYIRGAVLKAYISKTGIKEEVQLTQLMLI